MKKLIHGGDVYRNPDCIDFSANINPLGPPDSVKKAVAACVNDIAHYPDVQCKELKKRLGWAEQMEEEALIIGNGAAELIFALGYSLRPKRALLPQPTFAEYEQALLAAGCEVFYYPLSEENGFRLTEDFLQVLTGEIDMVFLCNPNNPTGKLIDPDLMLDIITYCRMNQIYVVIDECFMDFVKDCQKHTRKGLIPYNPYVVILNALTKLFAFPGIRIGYAMTSDADLIHAVNAQLPSWNVSAVAQLAGKEVVHHEEYVEESRKYVFREREYMYEEMKKLGLKVYEPSANFIFFKSDIPMYKKLLERHILIRNCDNFDGIMHGYCRVAIKKHNENEILLKEMENIINKNMAVT